MMSRALVLAAVSAIAIHLTGCDREASAPQPTQSAPAPAATASPPPPIQSPLPPSPSPTPEATAGDAAEVAPDLGERRNPARVLRAYAQALHNRDWREAARMWGKGSGVTAATLKAAYDRPVAPVLDIGEGTSDAGAGSIYYEAPVALRFGDDRPERGTLVLRRVNDVPGASAARLRWHIERSTIGAAQ